VRKLARDGVALKRSISRFKINQLRDSGFANDGLQTALNACSAILDSFYAYRVIIDSFVIVSLFSWVKHIPEYYRWLTRYVCACFSQFFGQGVFLLWQTLVPAATPVHYVFWYPAVAHILTHSVNLDFGPKSGFINKCRARVGFGLKNEAHLQLFSIDLRNLEKFIKV